MTDGPFKNLKLGSRWKRFAEAAQNDAVDEGQRCALACDALVHEILTDGTQALLTDLNAYANKRQLDIDPQSSVEAIFNNNDKTPFSDALQKELAFRLSEQNSTEAAISEALAAAVGHQVSEVRNRIEEECIRAHESEGMARDQFDRTVTQVRTTLEGLDTEAICNALRANERNAFKDGASKREGLDEGPSL